MSQTSRDPVNSRRVPTHENNSGETVRRLGTIIQSIFCAQSGASIRLTVWKWFSESRYPGALPPVLENFCRTFSPDPTDCPWVSEDELDKAKQREQVCFDFKLLTLAGQGGYPLIFAQINCPGENILNFAAISERCISSAAADKAPPDWRL